MSTIQDYSACCGVLVTLLIISMTVGTVIITNIITWVRVAIPRTMNKIYIEKEMAALGATLLLLLAVFLCRVDAQFSVNISCPSSGKKTLMSVLIYFV